MDTAKLIPAESPFILRKRVKAFFKDADSDSGHRITNSLSSGFTGDLFGDMEESKVATARESIISFLDLISGVIPDGDVYLFGGLLRDIAIFGRRGFSSDIDVVVDGDWEELLPILNSYGATQNKFGGYRLQVGNWPVDIWKAEETWAIKNGLVVYKDISSLTETTILNWDGILMNWRTKALLYRKGYFQSIKDRALDITLIQNPNPLGTVVRVLRHLRHKDALKISSRAVQFLVREASRYSFEEISSAEFQSYGNTLIDSLVYNFFRSLSHLDKEELTIKFNEINSSRDWKLKDELIGQVSLFTVNGGDIPENAATSLH